MISPGSGENEATPGISPVDPTPIRHGLRMMTPVPSGMFFAGFDEDDPPASELGPGDSHYELTDDTIDYAPDGSGTDWPTISPPAPSPFEPQPARAHEPESSNVFFPDPWYDKLIDSWGRFHFIVPLGLGAVVSRRTLFPAGADPERQTDPGFLDLGAGRRSAGNHRLFAHLFDNDRPESPPPGPGQGHPATQDPTPTAVQGIERE